MGINTTRRINMHTVHPRCMHKFTVSVTVSAVHLDTHNAPHARVRLRAQDGAYIMGVRGVQVSASGKRQLLYELK